MKLKIVNRDGEYDLNFKLDRKLALLALLFLI